MSDIRNRVPPPIQRRRLAWIALYKAYLHRNVAPPGHRDLSGGILKLNQWHLLRLTLICVNTSGSTLRACRSHPTERPAFPGGLGIWASRRSDGLSCCSSCSSDDITGVREPGCHAGLPKICPSGIGVEGTRGVGDMSDKGCG